MTEVYGPPGVGRTTFGVQLAVNAISLHDDHDRVVWIDTGTPLERSRFDHVYNGYRGGSQDNNQSSPSHQDAKKLSCFDKLTHLDVSSLPHLLMMFINPPAEFPPPKTALIVIDDLARFLLTNLPKTSARLRRADTTNANISMALRDKLARKALRRKFNIISELALGLSRTASRHGIAVVVLNHAATSVKVGERAMLVSALSTIHGWTSVIHTRLMLYRDFLPRDMSGTVSDDVASRLRFVRIEKNGGNVVSSSPRVMFHIAEDGIHEILNPSSTRQSLQQGADPGVLGAPPMVQSSPITFPSSSPLPPQQPIALDATSITSPTVIRTKQHHPPKRKAEEIADSEDEDEEDEEDQQVIRPPASPSNANVRRSRSASKAAATVPPVAATVDVVDEEEGDPVVSDNALEDESEPEATPFQNLDSDAELTQDED